MIVLPLADVVLIQTATVKLFNPLTDGPVPKATQLLVPSNWSAVPEKPVTQINPLLPINVPLLPLPDESVATVPLPSSKCQSPIGRVATVSVAVALVTPPSELVITTA